MELAIDVSGEHVAAVALRTWAEGVGEELIPMEEAASGRFRVSFAPRGAGIVWYHFVITGADGREWRYGARDGRRGGAGELRDWEPPSFQLTVFDPQAPEPAEAQELQALGRPFVEMRAGWARGEVPAAELVEAVETLRENCDGHAFLQATAPLGRPLEPGLGVLAHVTSLPGEAPGGPGAPGTPGTLGAGARAFVDELARAGVRYWQILPLNPTDGYGSPYAGISAFAGNVGLLATGGEEMPAGFDEGGLHSVILSRRRRISCDRVQAAGDPSPSAQDDMSGRTPATRRGAGWEDPSAQDDMSGRTPATRRGAGWEDPSAEDDKSTPSSALCSRHPDDDADPDGYRAFCAREADWLEPYACFMAIRGEMGAGGAGEDGAAPPWQEWPERFRRFDPALVEDDPRLREAAERHRRAQFEFQRQWESLHAYANARGVSIIGDMPIYVSADSADTWANPGIFQLGPDMRPGAVAGCPPDDFAADGQVWGNPLYDWEALRAQGFGWWLRRLRRAFELYDYVRLDHFIGFERYFAIPAGEKAVAGSYRPGPGYALFEAAYGEFGPLPIIAEDLGLITDGVRALMAACGFPGMDVIQFVDHGDPLADYRPRPGTVSYTGTHDNHTLRGYCAERYPGLDDAETARILMEKVVSSDAPVRVVALQDVLGLGDEARMNVPGTADGNWKWQAAPSDMETLAAHLAEIMGRAV